MIEIDVPRPEILLAPERGKPIIEMVPLFTIKFSFEHDLDPTEIPSLIFGMKIDQFIAVPLDIPPTEKNVSEAFAFLDTTVEEFMRAYRYSDPENSIFETRALFKLFVPWNPKNIPRAEAYAKDLERYGDLISRPISTDRIQGLEKLKEEVKLCDARAEIIVPFWNLLSNFERFHETRNIRIVKDSLNKLSELCMQTLSKQRFLKLYGDKLPHAKKHHPTNLEIWIWATVMNISEFVGRLPNEELKKNNLEMLKDPLSVLFYTKRAAEEVLKNPQDKSNDNILWLFIDNLFRTVYGIPVGNEADYRPWNSSTINGNIYTMFTSLDQINNGIDIYSSSVTRIQEILGPTEESKSDKKPDKSKKRRIFRTRKNHKKEIET